MTAEAAKRRDDWWRLHNGERSRILAMQRSTDLEAMRKPPFQYKAADFHTSETKEMNPKDLIEGWNTRNARQAMLNALPAETQERIADHLEDYPFALNTSTMIIPEGGILVRHGKSLYKIVALGPTFPVFPVTPDGKSVSGMPEDMIPGPQSMMRASIGNLNNRSLAVTVQRMGAKAPPAWKKLLAYQQSSVWPNDLPVTPDKVNPLQTRSLPVRRSDWLTWLAGKANIEYVADYYSQASHPMTETQKAAELKRPLKAELDAQAVPEQQDASWKMQDGLYLFRDNRWYINDRMELPDALAKRLLAEIPPKTHGKGSQWTYSDKKTPLEIKQQADFEADIVTALTPEQIAWSLLWYTVDIPDPAKPGATLVKYPFAHISERIAQSPLTLGFYASLAEDQREALVLNQLPFSNLSPTQQDQAAYLIPELQLLMMGSPPSKPPLIGMGSDPTPFRVLFITSTVGNTDDSPQLRLSLAPEAAPPGAN